MVRSVSIRNTKKEMVNAIFFFIKANSHKNIFLTLLLLIVSNSNSLSQNIKVYPTAGITWRSTAMNFFNFNRIIPADPRVPYNYEKNVQGLALNLGLQIYIFESIAIDYYPSLRYDYITHSFDPSKDRLLNVINGDSVFGNDSPIYVKEFIVDHNFNILIKKGNIEYGVGVTVVNYNKGFHYENPNPLYHNIEFLTYNVFINIPINKALMLEMKALYVPKDFPENPYEQYMMYSLRAYYKFDFLNKKK